MPFFNHSSSRHQTATANKTDQTARVTVRQASRILAAALPVVISEASQRALMLKATTSTELSQVTTVHLGSINPLISGTCAQCFSSFYLYEYLHSVGRSWFGVLQKTADI